MSVEINRFKNYKSLNNIINGWFNLKNYNGLSVDYECDCENEDVLFKCAYNWEKKHFTKWLSNEGEMYKTFLLNYFNEIKKIDDIISFKGKLVEEHPHKRFKNQYLLHLQYEELSNDVTLQCFPSINDCSVLYQVPIPINSEGKYANPFCLDNILKEETIKRMWEPFRDKTKYRLQLLHMLR